MTLITLQKLRDFISYEKNITADKTTHIDRNPNICISLNLDVFGSKPCCLSTFFVFIILVSFVTH